MCLKHDAHVEDQVKEKKNQGTDKGVAYRSWLGFGLYFRSNVKLLKVVY